MLKSPDVNMTGTLAPQTGNRQASDAMQRLKSLCFSGGNQDILPTKSIYPMCNVAAAHPRFVAINERKNEEIQAKTAEINILREAVKSALEEKDELLSDAIGLADENEDLTLQLEEKTAECEQLQALVKKLQDRLHDVTEEIHKSQKKDDSSAELWNVTDYEMAIAAMTKEMQRKVREVEADKIEIVQMMRKYQEEAQSSQEIAFKTVQENKALKKLLQGCSSCRVKQQQESVNNTPRPRRASILGAEPRLIQGFNKLRVGNDETKFGSLRVDIPATRKSLPERPSENKKQKVHQSEPQFSGNLITPRKNRNRIKSTTMVDNFDLSNEENLVIESPWGTICTKAIRKLNPAAEDGDVSRAESISCATPFSGTTQTETACTDKEKEVVVRCVEHSDSRSNVCVAQGAYPERKRRVHQSSDDCFYGDDYLDGITDVQYDEDADCDVSSVCCSILQNNAQLGKSDERHSTNPLQMASQRVGKRVSRSRFAQYRAGKMFTLSQSLH